MDLEQLLGLQVGDAHMIRMREDLRPTMSCVANPSTHLLGTRSIAIIQHTECGLLSITDEQMRFRLSSEVGRDASHLSFHAFTNLDSNVADQVKRVRENPFFSQEHSGARLHL